MEFKLSEKTDVSILHRYEEMVIYIEDSSSGRLGDSLLTTLLEERVLFDAELICEFFKIHEDELHDYLQKSGYIYNKA